MRRERLAGLVLAATALAIGVEATTFDVSFMADPVGPKALPLLSAAMLLFAGLHTALHPPPVSAAPSPTVVAKLASAVLAFLLYAVALDLLGFVLSTTLVVAVLSHLYGARPGRGIAAAAALSGALWLLFVQLLSLPLPIGRLWIR